MLRSRSWFVIFESQRHELVFELTTIILHRKLNVNSNIFYVNRYKFENRWGSNGLLMLLNMFYVAYGDVFVYNDM